MGDAKKMWGNGGHFCLCKDFFQFFLLKNWKMLGALKKASYEKTPILELVK